MCCKLLRNRRSLNESLSQSSKRKLCVAQSVTVWRSVMGSVVVCDDAADRATLPCKLLPERELMRLLPVRYVSTMVVNVNRMPPRSAINEFLAKLETGLLGKNFVGHTCPYVYVDVILSPKSLSQELCVRTYTCVYICRRDV
jgi:hypothetical protein